MSLTITPLPEQLTFWDTWHRTRGATGNDEVQRELREIFLESLPSLRRRRRRVLDLGCGQGHDVAAFARAGHIVRGLDFSPMAVEQARRAAPWFKRRRVKIRQGDLSDRLPYQDRFFDGVYSHLSLHYFDDATTRFIFSEVLRVTKPGGLFVLSVKSTDDRYFQEGERLADHIYLRNGHLRHFFDEQYLEGLLSGWDRVHMKPYQGTYASRGPSAFIRAVAHKPQH